MIVGLGNDILEIARVSLRLAEKVLTSEEIENVKEITQEYVAGRFSLKESYFKSLGTGINGNSFKDVSFLNRKDGSLYGKLHKYVKPKRSAFNFFHCTLSHDTFAMANVVLEKVHGNVYLGIGTNLGNRQENIQKAIEHLEKLGNVIKVSTVIETPAYGKTDQPDFLNCVVEIDTDFPPTVLMKKLLEIERTIGRIRTEKWGPRIIDLDILFYGNLVLSIFDTEVNLEIPHYDFENRQFFILPMCDIAPCFIHPVTGISMEEYSKRLGMDK